MLVNYLISNQNRKLKFFIALIILFCLSFYSYSYGKSEISLKQKVEKNFTSINSFPYLKTISYNSEQIIFRDKWGYIWKSNWPEAAKIPALGTFVSFKGELRQAQEIYKIHKIIIHRGYKVKLYVSIIALILLFISFISSFAVDSGGIYRKGY